MTSARNNIAFNSESEEYSWFTETTPNSIYSIKNPFTSCISPAAIDFAMDHQLLAEV